MAIQMKATEQSLLGAVLLCKVPGSNFWVCGWNPNSVLAAEQYFSLLHETVGYAVSCAEQYFPLLHETVGSAVSYAVQVLSPVAWNC